MKELDRMTGEIVDYDGQYITIRAAYSDTDTFIRRGYKTAEIVLEDSRQLSGRQRRSVYAMLRDIADWAGYEADEVKQIMKVDFWTNHLWQTADSLFSLSNAPMSVVAAFQKWLARFIVNNDVPTKKSMLEYVDDVADYTYSCLATKRCVCCGKKADLHHCEGSRVGMGRDRESIIHLGSMVLPLCREHHTEAHYAEKEFLVKWHLEPIEADKTICRLYGLKAEKARNK